MVGMIGMVMMAGECALSAAEAPGFSFDANLYNIFVAEKGLDPRGSTTILLVEDNVWKYVNESGRRVSGLSIIENLEVTLRLSKAKNDTQEEGLFKNKKTEKQKWVKTQKITVFNHIITDATIKFTSAKTTVVGLVRAQRRALGKPKVIIAFAGLTKPTNSRLKYISEGFYKYSASTLGRRKSAKVTSVFLDTQTAGQWSICKPMP